jgi:hypothetical protein
VRIIVSICSTATGDFVFLTTGEKDYSNFSNDEKRESRKAELRIADFCKTVAITALMKRFFVLFLTISAGVSSVCANLGDGGDRIDDSYGNLIERHLLDDGTVSTLYHKDRYLYFVLFDNGVSVLEKYSRVDGADLSEKEIAKFLKANAGRTATWIRDETSTSKESRFKRSDHKAEATYGKVDDRLTLTVRELRGGTPEIKN